MSNKKKYVLRKLFDCQDMPRKLREKFYALYRPEHYDDDGEYIGSEVLALNDTVVEWTIADIIPEDQLPGVAEVDAWLIKNGAEGPKSKKDEGETVLIKHWW